MQSDVFHLIFGN